jgi:hypothetical protein
LGVSFLLCNKFSMYLPHNIVHFCLVGIFQKCAMHYVPARFQCRLLIKLAGRFQMHD